MPELPDVEVFKRYLDRTALHRKVDGVEVHRARRVLEGTSRRTLERRIRGHELASSRRHGKVLFVGLDDGAGAFVEVLSGRRGSIKAALMNQAALAGIGNVYSDEILFRAKIHPRTAVSRLSEKDFRSLHRAARKVLEGAIEYRVDPERMPRTWLLPHREGGASCPRCGAGLRRIEVNQRSAWVCERCQERR